LEGTPGYGRPGGGLCGRKKETKNVKREGSETKRPCFWSKKKQEPNQVPAQNPCGVILQLVPGGGKKKYHGKGRKGVDFAPEIPAEKGRTAQKHSGPGGATIVSQKRGPAEGKKNGHSNFPQKSRKERAGEKWDEILGQQSRESKGLRGKKR